MSDATPYSVPKEPGRWRAIALAALVHLALLAFLWIGVHWQSETPVTIEAEVWSPQPQEAAPLPVPPKEPETQPAPVKEPEPPPVVKEPPKPKVEEPPVAKPDIALEQEKKRKEQEEKKRLEEEERERQAKLKEKKRLEELQEQKRLEEKRLAELKEKEKEKEKEKKRQEEERLAKLKQQEEQKRLEKEKAAKAELARKAEAEKKRKQQEADEQMAAKARDEEMRRITGGVTGTGGSGEAAKSQGGRADGSYAQRVAAKIKSNISFVVPEGMAGNPAVEYVVDLLPDGSVAGMRKTKSSGIPGFDEAVRRAIEKSQPYPKDKTGSVPSSFIGIHKPKDQ